MYGRYFVQYWFRQACIFYLVFLKISLCLSAFSELSASSVFQLYLDKPYNIYMIIVYMGVRYIVILFSLNKKQFVKTNIALRKFDYPSRHLPAQGYQ